ncbi:ATP phosphoribosyltransferase regulatory subunit [Heliorestis acidaminivorans]|uniref:ATP phosphoribosyltransferase regulatory subunit n=1 Tax=Heliorestis acidaminivorans TaxID=553427 RepID=A0A6I0EQZ8_9FIRM|nr:ATP phosphoribosyltransferase regulatory subunit [Heliorestis acidaminivorans]KAB2952656.1 ATP phosphoribosyltransferase regulatory subunit [Heliorestis acidaminivorans]
MAKDRSLLPIPAGMRDFLPGEAQLRRVLENKWAQLYTSWSYEEVMTPTVEYLDVLTIDTGEEMAGRLFQFFDRKGHIMVLRPEMTTPIARLMASRLYKDTLPQRLFYGANVFRYDEPQAGRQREIFQSGVELIGASSPLADAEVIALAVEALRQSGLEEFQISIGQIEVFNGIMDELPLSPEDKSKIRDLVAKKDFVSLEEFLQNHHLNLEQAELLLRLPTFHGGKEALEEASILAVNEKARQGLENLHQVYSALCLYGVEEYVAFDLGVLRGFDYYTGIVFEGYTVGLGFPICGGGRYDRLLSQVGYDCPATGFAIGLDRVLLALSRNQQPKTHTKPDVLLGGDDLVEIFAKAARLRARGFRVEVDVLGRQEEALKAYGRERGIADIIYFALSPREDADDVKKEA